MCLLHVDATSLNAISFNNKVFEAPRAVTGSSSLFSSFVMVSPPFGNPTGVPNRNTDGLPSVYALSETWFRGPGTNETVRAEVVPIRRDSQDFVGTGAAWDAFTQAAAGGAFLAHSGGQFIPETGIVPERDLANDDTLPQWMPVGVGNLELFACGGRRTEDGRVGSTWLLEYKRPTLPIRGTADLPDLLRIQDILNGDSRFTAPTGPAPPLTGNPIAPPLPPIGAPAGTGITAGYARCALTQNGDNVPTRTLNVFVPNGTSLLNFTMTNYGPVTQPLSNGTVRTFNRFRSVSAWVDLLPLFPAAFGTVESVVPLAAGTDDVVNLFFVTQNAGRRMLWHTRRTATGTWLAPRDVLLSSGAVRAPGTPYPMPIAGAFCPDPAAPISRPTEEILLTWFNSDLNAIVAQAVVRQPRVWFQGGPSTIYSPPNPVPQTGITTGFQVFRSRISSRPF
jgi:hypothetical protein